VIYLDHNASAPLLPEVFAAMRPFLEGLAANASSLHGPGRRARAAIDCAREKVAALIGADATGVHFCSGGTEADAWALRSAFRGATTDPGTLAIGATEHPAIRNTAAALTRDGVVVRELPVDGSGRLAPFTLASDTALVAVMAANNELGNLYDIAAVADQAHAVGARMHSDLVQAAGKIAVSVAAWGLDSAALSAHKIGGPQGVGALWIAPGQTLDPLVTGGGQERGLRSGTENVAGIVGFGAAAELAMRRLSTESARQAALRDELAARLLQGIAGAVVLGDAERRLPNTLSIAVPGVAGEAMVMRLDAVGVAISTGSACSSGSGKPSPVLVAMGLAAWQIKGALRFSLGPTTTAAQIAAAADHTIAAAKALQRLSQGL